MSGTSSTNAELMREMRAIIAQGKPVDPEMRDRMLFTALVDVYDKLEELSPALTFYKFGMWAATAIGVSFLTLIGGILTGRVSLIFK